MSDARDPATGRFAPSIWGGKRGEGSKRPLPIIGVDREQPTPDAKRAGQKRRKARLERLGETFDQALDNLKTRLAADEVEPHVLNQIVRDVGNRLMGMPKQPLEHLTRPAAEMSDDELADIATGGGPPADGAEGAAPVADDVE